MHQNSKFVYSTVVPSHLSCLISISLLKLFIDSSSECTHAARQVRARAFSVRIEHAVIVQVACGVTRVDDLFDSVTTANVYTEFHQLIERLVAYVPVAAFFIVGNFDRDGFFVIFAIAACSSTIFLFNIKRNISFGVNCVIGRCLYIALYEAVAKVAQWDIATHVMNRNLGNFFIAREIGIGCQINEIN